MVLPLSTIPSHDKPPRLPQSCLCSTWYLTKVSPSTVSEAVHFLVHASKATPMNLDKHASAKHARATEWG